MNFITVKENLKACWHFAQLKQNYVNGICILYIFIHVCRQPCMGVYVYVVTNTHIAYMYECNHVCFSIYVISLYTFSCV